MALLEARDLSRHFGGLTAGDVVYRGETIARVGALAAILGTGRVVLDRPAIERRERTHVRKAYLGG